VPGVDKLGSNYYFTDNVCKYESGGCVGNPLAGVTYTVVQYK